MTDNTSQRITQALTWIDANRDGTDVEFRRRFKYAADMLRDSCISHGYIERKGDHYELTIPGLRRLHEIRSRE